MPGSLRMTTNEVPVRITTFNQLMEYFTHTVTDGCRIQAENNQIQLIPGSASSNVFTFTAKTGFNLNLTTLFTQNTSGSTGTVTVKVNAESVCWYDSERHFSAQDNWMRISYPLKKNDVLTINLSSYTQTVYLKEIYINGPRIINQELNIKHNDILKTVTSLQIKKDGKNECAEVFPSHGYMYTNTYIDGNRPKRGYYTVYILQDRIDVDNYYVVASVDSRKKNEKKSFWSWKNAESFIWIDLTYYKSTHSIGISDPTHIEAFYVDIWSTPIQYDLEVSISSSETKVLDFSVNIYDESGTLETSLSKSGVTSYKEAIPIGYTYKIFPRMADGYGAFMTSGKIKDNDVSVTLNPSSAKLLTVNLPTSVQGTSIATSGYHLSLGYSINSTVAYTSTIQTPTLSSKFYIYAPTNNFVELNTLTLTNAPLPVGQTATTKTLSLSHDTFMIQLTSNMTVTIATNGKVTVS